MKKMTETKKSDLCKS